MKKILTLVHRTMPFNNIIKNTLFFLLLSPFFNYILTNIYYYNCGGYLSNFYDFIILFNPFYSCNYLCFILSSFISMNLYIKSYIFYIFVLYMFSFFI